MEREVLSVSRELNFSEKLGNKRETLRFSISWSSGICFQKKSLGDIYKKCSNSLVIRSETEITWSSNENFHYLKYTRKTHTQAECWRKALLVLTLICFGTAHLRENMTSAKKINNLHDPKIPLLRICQKKSSQMWTT